MAASSRSKTTRGSASAATVTRSRRITAPTWAKRSTSAQSASETTPTGRPSSTTTAARWERLGISDSASATVWVGASSIGVSKTRWRCLTHWTTSVTTGIGMSCGMTVRPPRRAVVSAIRLPAMAVMLATTSGSVAPVPSWVARSTSYRLATAEWRGTMKTSS